MKKILIISLYGNSNFGNKLQLFALNKTIMKLNRNFVVVNQKVNYYSSNLLKRFIKKFLTVFMLKSNNDRKEMMKEKRFNYFNKKYLKYTKNFVSNYSIINKRIKNYDYYIYGSDQIWNPNSSGKTKLYLGYYTDNNIAYAASFGVSKINEEDKNTYFKGFNNFKYISVREMMGIELINSINPMIKCECVLDPTMLLTCEEWDKYNNKPNYFDKIIQKKYILNYFLGELSYDRKKEIERIAKENDCKIINLLDKNDPFYESGPSEFLYLEKNAFLICTDSFHSCVFGILYNRPFIIFDREQKGLESMNSRIDTLINKFKLKDRRYNGKRITKENLEHNYTEAYKILEKEREKSKNFLIKTLDLKENSK